MAERNSLRRRVRVGEFEVDLDSGDVVGEGGEGRLQVQSLELLKALLECPGTMVPREELRRRLWPDDTFVDFDHGLNAAVRRLREAFGDSADSPRFVETIPRKGYRLIAATETAPTPSAGGVPAVPPGANQAETRPLPAGWRAVQASYLTITIGIVAIASVSAWLARTPGPSGSHPPLATFTIDVPAGWTIQTTDHVALSPDSRYLAYTAAGPDNRRSLWLRRLNEPGAEEIPGTESAMGPFWSPDSSRVGFFAGGVLKAFTLADRRVHTLTAVAPATFRGGAAAWTSTGDLLFVPLGASLGTPVHAAALRRLDGATGAVQPVAASSESRAYVDHVAVSAIPHANAFTFLRWAPSMLEMTAHVGEVGSPRVADLGRADSRVIVTESGHAVYVHDGSLVARPFDVAGRRFAGQAYALAQDVAVIQPMFGHFAATSDVIAYLTRASMAAGTRMQLVDRTGATIRTIAEGADFSTPRASADGARVAVARRDPVSGTRDIWVHDLEGHPPVRVTFDGHDDVAPAWSRDGRTILFTSDRSGERQIYRKDIEGGTSETLAFSSTDSKGLNAWSPDGQLFVYDTGVPAKVDAQGRINKDLFIVSLSGAPQIRPLAATPASESSADISPDGSLVAYQSSETGRAEVFVETFPGKGGRWQVTTAGAMEPMWRGDGRELFFLSAGNELCAVAVDRSGASVRFGTPRVLFALRNASHTVRRFAPLPDGQRFITLVEQPHPQTQQMTVLVNWRSALPN